MNETKYWLWLSMVFGTASRRIWEAMCLFENAADAYIELSSGEHNVRLSENEIKNIHNTQMKNVISLIEYCNKNNIEVIGYGDNEYPLQLRHILNPPAVLYCKGNISCLSGKRTVTSVGARKASQYSLKAAEIICRELAKKGIVIVSGFAKGIDITSHLAAANEDCPTVCVLGCGVDVDYPKDNFQYRDAILASGGVFISEFPPGTPPHAQNFPIRNRILAALGRAVIVFEASSKSGSLITAGIALEQGREIFCLPPSDIFSESFFGNISLLRDGALAVYSSLDILDCFKIGGANDSSIRFDTFNGISTFGNKILQPHKKQNTVKNTSVINHKVKKEQDIKKNDDKNEELMSLLTPVQKNIYEMLVGCTLHADVISQKLGIDTEELLTELTELEILGAIRSLPGKMFSGIGNKK